MIPDAVLQASLLQRADARGVVAYVAEAAGTFTTPFSRNRTRTRTWVVAVDGDPRRAIVLAIETDGKPGDAAARAKAQAEAEQGYADPERKLRPPYDYRYMASYRFTPAGERTWAFEGDGDRHGRGTFTLTADHRVQKLAYTPNRYPAPARSGGLTLERGQVAPGWWSMQKLTIGFHGGIGPLSGGLDLVQLATGHRRFPSVAAALAAAPPD